VVGFVLGIIYGAMNFKPGMKPEQLQQMFMNSEPMHIAQLVVGAAGTALGGYVAAWMGRVLPLRHALATGMVSLATALLVWAAFPNSLSLGYGIAAMLLVLPAALVGGYLRAVQAGAVARRTLR
jgi:hypothetical protein